jgi:hypothetical protein
MQSALEVKLMRDLFAAARARLSLLGGPDSGPQDVRLRQAQHAAETPWVMLTTIAEALGHNFPESSFLQSDLEVRLDPCVVIYRCQHQRPLLLS